MAKRMIMTAALTLCVGLQAMADNIIVASGAMRFNQPRADVGKLTFAEYDKGDTFTLSESDATTFSTSDILWFDSSEYDDAMNSTRFEGCTVRAVCK